MRRLSPCRPERLRIQLVTVVPTLLPMIDANGLMQFHDAAVDKADHHDRGSAGTLDHSGDAQAKEKTL